MFLQSLYPQNFEKKKTDWITCKSNQLKINMVKSNSVVLSKNEWLYLSLQASSSINIIILTLMLTGSSPCFALRGTNNHPS